MAEELLALKRTALLQRCAELGIKKCSSKNKATLVGLILARQLAQLPPIAKPAPTSVLELCPVPVDVGAVANYISGYMASRASYYVEKKRAPFVEDELAEYYIAKSSGGLEIGGGSCAMDVKAPADGKFAVDRIRGNIGIDVMCVIMNKAVSNEKSLIQNFSSSGADLDTIFKQGRDQEAVSQYMEQYSQKLGGVKIKHSLGELFILAFVSTATAVFLVCFRISMPNIQHVVSGGFIGSGKSPVNILVNNFIDPAYGTVKLYKSKKRMELRLLPAVLKSKLAVKIYELPSKVSQMAEASEAGEASEASLASGAGGNSLSNGISRSAINQTMGTDTALPASL
jgi:hypothetical protein